MTAKFVCAAFAAWLVLLNSARAAEQKQNAYPFFPFCIDWHDAKRQSFEQQAEMLKSLGYDGVGHTWLDKVAERLKTLKELGYKGPIGLQCYGIGGDAREHLAGSMAAWRKLSANLKD